MSEVLTKGQLSQLGMFDLEFLDAELSWLGHARAKQLPPSDWDWPIWLLNAGRGFGKTKTGAAWCRKKAYSLPGSIGHVIARTSNDLRRTVFEGPAGLLAAIPQGMIRAYNRGYSEILLHNGTKILGFTAEEPDKLRGPQCHWCWCDELAAWVYVTDTWDQVIFSTRLKYERGNHHVNPQILVSTTPRPLDIVRELRKRARVMKDGKWTGDVAVTLGSSYENRDNLAPSFFNEIIKYEGTVIGRQEIHGELIDPEEAGVIKRSWFRKWPHDEALPEFVYIVYSLDTAFTEKTWDKKESESDFSACTVWGVFYDKPRALREGERHHSRVNILMLDCWREKYGLPALMERVRREIKVSYGADKQVLKPVIGSGTVTGTGRKPDIVVIEDKGSGISLRQMLARENIITFPYNPGRADKLDRLHAVSHVPHSGIIWIPESEKNLGQFKSWTEDWFAEVCVYCGDGSTKHDDYVDSTSQAWRLIADRFLRGGVEQKPLPEDVPPPPQKRGNPYAR